MVVTPTVKSTQKRIFAHLLRNKSGAAAARRLASRWRYVRQVRQDVRYRPARRGLARRGEPEADPWGDSRSPARARSNLTFSRYGRQRRTTLHASPQTPRRTQARSLNGLHRGSLPWPVNLLKYELSEYCRYICPSEDRARLVAVPNRTKTGRLLLHPAGKIFSCSLYSHRSNYYSIRCAMIIQSL